MNRRSALRTFLAASAGSLFTPLFARADGDEDLVIRSESRLVLLDVSVKDPAGGFVSGLSQENFSVFENGRPQSIVSFDHGDMPVTVGLIVDESRSMAPKRSAVLTAALIFISESNPKDEIFVLNFNDDVKPGLLAPTLFSDDIQELRAGLLRGVSEGRTVLNDAVVAGLAQLELGTRDKKALVLISDGGDNASTHTRRETIDRVERSAATIYAIGLYDADDPDRDPGILRQLAGISGGEAYFPPTPADTGPACRRIAHDIRARYTLGYIPPPGKSTNTLRNIQVRASAPGHPKLMARTRSSYRYDQPDTPKPK